MRPQPLDLVEVLQSALELSEKGILPTDTLREALALSALRQCGRCKAFKALSAFTRDTSRSDGFRNRCRDCEKSRTATRVFAPEYREKKKIRDAQRVVDPKKKAAGGILNGAVRRGVVSPWPACAVPECRVSKVEAHHPDYDRPLDVVWLCRSHHRLAHTAINGIAALDGAQS